MLEECQHVAAQVAVGLVAPVRRLEHLQKLLPEALAGRPCLPAAVRVALERLLKILPKLDGIEGETLVGDLGSLCSKVFLLVSTAVGGVVPHLCLATVGS